MKRIKLSADDKIRFRDKFGMDFDDAYNLEGEEQERFLAVVMCEEDLEKHEPEEQEWISRIADVLFNGY